MICCAWSWMLLSAFPMGGVPSGSGQSSFTVKEADLIKHLKARDSQFDNAKLEYTRWGEINLPISSHPPQMMSKEEWMRWRGGEMKTIPFRFHEHMVVRGAETTFLRQSDPAFKQPDGELGVVPYQKWSNTAGLAREITDRPGGRIGDRIMEIKPPHPLILEQRMAVEFVHGFGFGKRIKDATVVESNSSRTIIRGTIQIWRKDLSTYEIELDSQFIVRKAVIDCDVEGNLTRFEVATQGSVEKGGFVFAKEGHFKRIWQGQVVDGKRTGEPKIVNEFKARFNNVQFNLDDGAYAELIKMEITPGTTVFDRVRGRNYVVLEDGTEVERPNFLPKPSPANAFARWIFVNLAMMILLALLRIIWQVWPVR